MSVFELILSPFIFIIKQLFLFGYYLTGNYGWAIILLSFFISLLLLPVFVYIEKAKKKTDAVKRKMQPLVDEIKRCYKGQERYYYLKTLNRQHGYSPLKAMIPILSLLLQIPFFIAAYQYLEHFEALQGVSFGFIKDLSQPDGLLGAVNILPIAMTVVNLITAWFYTRNGNTSERKQMLIVALAFLILLFKLPSGLVMYWTMNNVFSFFRLFVTNPEVFKNTQNNKLNFNINKYKKYIPNITLFLIFFVVYFFFAGNYYYTGVERGILNIAGFVLIPLELIFLSVLIRYKKHILSKKLYLFFYLALFLIQIVIFILSEKKIDTHIFGLNLFSLSSVFFTGIILIITILPHLYKLWNITPIKTDKKYNTLYILSLLYIFGLIFFWNPLIVFSSFPQNFNFAGISFITHNIKPFIIAFTTSLLVYYTTPQRFRNFILIFFLFIAIVIFSYSSLIPFDVGTLQGNLFSKENNLKVDLSNLFIEVVFLWGVLYLSKWLVQNNKYKILLYTLVLLNISIIVQSLYTGIKTDCFFKNKTTQREEKNKPMVRIPFSKTKPNILIFFPDGAQGWYMNDQIKEQPEIRELYDGFTWYPNSIATSNYTYASVPAMICGEKYTIEEMNKDNKHSIAQKYTNATRCFIKKVNSEGYFLTSSRFKYAKMDTKEFDNYIPIWDDKWSELLGLKGHNETWYTRLWENAVFNSSPLFLKAKVYNHRNWIVKDNVDMNSSEVYKYNFLRVLPKISDTTSTDSNFIFIHSMSTHVPWDMISKDGKFIRDVTPYENHKWVMNEFAKYIKWMKDNGVYDNTKIIIVSDHGPSWWHYKHKYKVDVPVKHFDWNKISMEEFLRLNILLMVKDFGSRGKMNDNWRLMTNADMMNIAFDENNPTKVDSASRTVKTFYTMWHTDLHTRKKYKNKHAYEIKDYVFDLNNWKIIE